MPAEASNPRSRLETMAERTRALLESVPDGGAPYVAVDGDVAAGAVHGSRTPPWTLGFWLGQLHLTEAVIQDPSVRRRLDSEQEKLCGLVMDRGPEFDHDLGFLMILGPLADLRSGVRPQYREALAAACEALAGRYNPEGRFLRAHGWQGSTGAHIDQPGDNDGPAGRFIADTWMNLPLLLWGAREFDRPAWADVAVGHARTARELLTTPEGWVLHGYEIDPVTGERRGPSTIQGNSPTSPWSRAQAWTVYGMELTARMLGAQGWLPPDEAEQWRGDAAALARRFLDHSLPSGVAPWDFSMPQGEQTPSDTSASAIVLAALTAWEGSAPHGTTGPPGAADRLRAALEPYSQPDRAGTGLLGGGLYYYPAGRGIDEPCAWGDYFWMEAAARGQGIPVPYDL